MEQSLRDRYEVVIGLEVHAQLLTQTKAYSSDLNAYGSAPNTNISAITLGQCIRVSAQYEHQCDHAWPPRHLARDEPQNH